jgi:hypothetical protein
MNTTARDGWIEEQNISCKEPKKPSKYFPCCLHGQDRQPHLQRQSVSLRSATCMMREHSSAAVDHCIALKPWLRLQEIGHWRRAVSEDVWGWLIISSKRQAASARWWSRAGTEARRGIVGPPPPKRPCCLHSPVADGKPGAIVSFLHALASAIS